MSNLFKRSYLSNFQRIISHQFSTQKENKFKINPYFILFAFAGSSVCAALTVAVQAGFAIEESKRRSDAVKNMKIDKLDLDKWFKEIQAQVTIIQEQEEEEERKKTENMSIPTPPTLKKAITIFKPAPTELEIDPDDNTIMHAPDVNPELDDEAPTTPSLK